MMKKGENGSNPREERLQVMLRPDEIEALDDFRFKYRMPSRAAAIRELLRRGLGAQGYADSQQSIRSSAYGVLQRAERDE